MLTLTLTDNDYPFSASVQFDRWDGDRAQYRYHLTMGGASASGDDLRMGALREPTLGEAMRALLDFLGAYAESAEYAERTGGEPDNLDLFPPELRAPVLTIGADTLAMLAREAIHSDDDGDD